MIELTLAELRTPPEKIQIIEYASNSNKVVKRWHMLQHIAGPYYKGEDYIDTSGIEAFNIYIKYKEGKNGLLHTKHLTKSSSYKLKLFEDETEKANLGTPQGFIKLMNDRIAEGKFIGKAEIEFIRQFDVGSADQLEAYREKYYERKNLTELAAQAIAEEKAAQEERQRKEQELSKQRAILLGWGDSMTPLRINRVMATLDSLINVDNRIMHRHQFIKEWLKNGWRPYKEEGEIHRYGSKWNPKQSKPKKAYYIRKNNMSYKITKTEYEFAMYLIENQKV